MGFPSPATDYIEERLSLDKLLISRPSSTYLMRSANTCWRAGIQQGALLIVDRSATPCDGSVVVCQLAGGFHIRRFRTHPYRHFEHLTGDGRQEKINSDEAEENDGIFGVIIHAINDMRTQEFDDNPVI